MAARGNAPAAKMRAAPAKRCAPLAKIRAARVCCREQTRRVFHPDRIVKATAVFFSVATAALAIALVYFLFSARGSRIEQTDADAERSVIAAHERMIAAAEALNLDELFRSIVESEHTVLAANGRIFPTREAALQQTRESFRELVAIKYAISERRVILLPENHALLVTAGTTTAKTGDGREFSTPFAQTLLLIRQDGAWRVLHSHQSTPRR